MSGFVLSREFTFSAAHALPHLPVGHKCHGRHGHTYRVVVEIAATDVDERGFVVDYEDLDSVGAWIDGSFDHRDLDEAFDDLGLSGPSTAERLAVLIGDFAAKELVDCAPRVQVRSVSVSEHATTWVTWRP